MSENRVLRRIFHNEELHNLLLSSNITRIIISWRMRWTGCVARMREKMCSYRVLVGKSERKRPLGSPRHKWEDNFKIDLREIGWGCRLDSSGSHRDQRWALVDTVMKLRVL
jgi:hypothetical protein